MIFEAPLGLTTFEAVQQAKEELTDVSIQLLTEVKLRNYLRRASQYKVENQSTLITARKLVRKTMPSWKRAAYNRVRQIIPDGVERHRKTRAIMNASAKPWTVDEDWKGFRRAMKKDGKGAAEPLYLLKKSILKKKRQDKRRKVLKQLQHVDQIAAQQNMLALKKSKGKALVLKDTSAMNIIPDPSLTKLFRDQRQQIAAAQKALNNFSNCRKPSGGRRKIPRVS